MCERTPETREAIAAGMRASWADPEIREKRRLAARQRRIDKRREKATEEEKKANGG